MKIIKNLLFLSYQITFLLSVSVTLYLLRCLYSSYFFNSAVTNVVILVFSKIFTYFNLTILAISFFSSYLQITWLTSPWDFHSYLTCGFNFVQ